jgi:hypothetical protein
MQHSPKASKKFPEWQNFAQSGHPGPKLNKGGRKSAIGFQQQEPNYFFSLFLSLLQSLRTCRLMIAIQFKCK